MLVRLFVQTFASYAIVGVVLFVAAGTIDWLAAWIFLAEMIVVSLVCGPSLARHDPALMRERLASPIQKGQSKADKVLVTILVSTLLGMLALIGLDAVRFDWSSVPLWARLVGALLLFVSVWMSMRVFRENSFASPVVKIQTDRGHKAITSGPYRYVRHPMYSGALLFFIGMTLQLGSWWGLAGVVVLAVLFAIRTTIEEKALRAGLIGYDAYAARVRYRLIPAVW